MLTKLFRLVNKGVSFIYFLLLYQNASVAYVLAHHHFPFKLSNLITTRNKEIIFKKTGNRIQIQQVARFSAELPALVQVLNDSRAKVISSYTDYFVLQFDNILMNVYSVANLVTVQEIFVDRIYDIFLPKKNVVLFDIGMNVGCACLFFSQLPFVDEIRGFEPFPDTFEEARKNVSLNPALSSKISMYNWGISDFSGQTDVSSFESGSAVANIHSATDDKQAGKKITLTIKAINDILKDADFNQSNIVLKVDCEGEEYAIMDQLSSYGYLEKIYCLIVEWHIKGADSLLQAMHKYGFTTFHLPKPDGLSGMIYASK